MSDSKAILQNIVDAAAARVGDYDRGFAEGVAQAKAELTPQITKVANAAVQNVLTELEQLEAFRGQVMVHAAGREILRMKESMASGMCWDCGIRAPSPVSRYRRCTHCDQTAE